MTAEGLAALLTALAALVTAVGAIYLQRQRRAALDADELEKERNHLRRYVEVLLRYIHYLLRLMAQHGITVDSPVPDEPKEPTT